MTSLQILKNFLTTATQNRLPDFLVLGTQKGGTTSLHKLLEQHPNIFLPKCKEVQYFTLYSNKNRNWYANHFKEAGHNQLIGDITPYYLFHPKAPKRIKKLLPKAKLITLLRDPVERAISQYFHAKRNGFETLDLERALKEEKNRLKNNNEYSHQKHSYVSRSRYLEQLDRYKKLFSPNQHLILKSEDLFNNTEQIWQQILHFLELPRINLPCKMPKENQGKGEAKEINHQIRIRLRKEFSTTVLGIKKRYGFDWGW